MAVIECTRRVEFDAAHRVMQHESKCKYLHGHRYVVEASFITNDLDNLGRVLDFSYIKEELGTWIDEHWDHTTILHEADKALGNAISKHTRQSIYYLPYNPTAENMARYLLQNICPKLFKVGDVKCKAIRIWETPNCSASTSITL